ncbi:hypothetical protein C8J57DRAFT_1222888 [Mycena rebaudengoi]|nr:hypothetical protein C8J57DRAFT_1222888 [Mycena rebaudengoi]
MQHFLHEQDLRVGCENHMIIGIAYTFWEFWVNAAALDVPVADLLMLIDQPHMKQVSILQFLEVLVNYIPEASGCRHEIYLRYRTQVAKLQAEVVASPIPPLATSGKKQGINHGVEGRLPRLSQTARADGRGLRLPTSLQWRGWDVLPQYGPVEESFEMLRPILQLWHLMWPQPQSGNSGPQSLARLQKLPSFEELEAAAKKSFETYVASGARYQVRMDMQDEATGWTAWAPLGDSWDAATAAIP